MRKLPMEEEPSAPSAVDVSIPKGSSLPGCEENDECFMPSMVTVSVDGTVTWTNDDTAAHTVTSGTASDGPDGVFDSSILMAGKTFEHTFDEEGSYDYFCVVHPWMTGNVTVE
ncbi:plastocyanin/azurin family copper-binding protein [Candidatus Nitrosotenuis chungbukensis]|uniref:cupredoxin domain-containing protein n=1 Tax=Candidatus Nitrosotenuis chungbukensis TaxID=1353246 RepID=UPI002672A98B|nr:plastocyanin/azurin family copper-binding protein [Candidatus Nitrosotenuis chungbukensis]WKT57760.1 plastocyanin/azurin family copper-binding protein [Candidatus Nitrosotenuis chungbukensis]